MGYFFPFLFLIGKGLFLALLVVLLIDIYFLYQHKNGIKATRKTPERFSNGDENTVSILIENNYFFTASLTIIDEIPIQFQKRNFSIQNSLDSGEKKNVQYTLRPSKRGEYHFGKLNIYVRGLLYLVSRRYSFDDKAMIPTYPSFLHMKKYEMMAFTNRLHEYGMKKIRRIGYTMEFDQIKNYVIGDDIRHINWKATAKMDNLMVNQFQDERAQPVYSIIDKGRVMKMPFAELSLLDYAINSTLILSNIALLKHDRAGMLSFSNSVENMVVADRRSSQLELIMENLYRMNTDFKETDFGRLYSFVKSKITHRSLLLIYTNFETLDALHRQLKYLKALAKNHLLVLLFFTNTELENLIDSHAKTVQEIYDKSIAEKFEFEKRLIVAELKKYGIHAVLTKPENLSANTINKYLELKARGLF